MTPAARLQAAVELLIAIEETASPADRAVADYLRGRRYIGAKDRRAITEQVYAVLRARARLDWWLSRQKAVARPRGRLIAWLLLAGGADAAGLARLFAGDRFGPAPLEAAEQALVEALAGHDLDHPEQPDWVRLEVPDWLLPQLAGSLGDGWRRELAALGAAAPVDLRVNRLKADRERARAALAAEGIETEPGRWSPLALRSDGRRAIAATRTFRDGLVEVQDEGSQLVALLTEARPGMRVCDFCAGAGGKTLALAAAMDNRGQIVACDVRQGRLDRAGTRLRRAGAHNVTRQRLAGEIDSWVKRRRRSFDRVLVDAPCSGSGTWRRNPDARWRLDAAGLDELIDLQARILDSAARLVRPGGRLVYATCSLLRAENEAQVERFLGRHEDFAVLPVAALWPAAIGGAAPAESAHLRLTPATQGTDGFFLAVLQRAAGSAPEAGAA